MKLFRIRGIQLSVHASFFLLLAYGAWEGWQLNEKNWIAGGLSVLLILLLFVCVTLHELGHAFTAQHFGVGVPRILLLPIGGMAEFDSIPRQPRRELLITLAGPAVNFVLASLLWLGLFTADRWLPVALPELAGDMATTLLQLNLIMGLFNLAPIFPMDGGRMFRALLATRLPYLRATQIAARTGQILAVMAIGVAVYREWWMLTFLFAFIFFVGDLELKALERREREDAHWRSSLARLSGPSPIVPEPPPALPP